MATAPNPNAFGAQAAYLQALGNQTGNIVSGPLNMLALAGHAKAESGQYLQALQAANTAAVQEEQIKARAEGQKAYLGALPGLGRIGALSFMPSDQFGVTTNADHGSAVDAVTLDNVAAESLGEKANAVESLAKVGMSPTAPYLKGVLRNPLAVEGPDIVPYLTPENKTDQIRADASMISANADTVRAQAAMINANRPRGGGGGRGGGGSNMATITETMMTPDGKQVVVKRKVPVVEAEGYSVDTGSTPPVSQLQSRVEQRRAQLREQQNKRKAKRAERNKD